MAAQLVEDYDDTLFSHLMNSSSMCCIIYFPLKVIINTVSGRDHTIFPSLMPWTTVTSYLDQLLKARINTQYLLYSPPLLGNDSLFIMLVLCSISDFMLRSLYFFIIRTLIYQCDINQHSIVQYCYKSNLRISSLFGLVYIILCYAICVVLQTFHYFTCTCSVAFCQLEIKRI